MDDKFIRIEDKLDSMLVVQTSIQANLQEHMRRTELAEEGIQKLSEALQPVQRHVHLIEALGKLIAWMVGLGAGIATIMAIFK